MSLILLVVIGNLPTCRDFWIGFYLIEIGMQFSPLFEINIYYFVDYCCKGHYISAVCGLLRFDLSFIGFFLWFAGFVKWLTYYPWLLLFTSLRNKNKVDPIEEISEPTPPSKYDVFLTHDWGKDELGRNNHGRVSRLNTYLKDKGLVTWFDEDRMEGDIRFKMADGIENSKYVVVCVTERYLGKISGSDPRDNCNFEFWQAFDLLGTGRMIPVVMEARMRDTKTWKGRGGGALRGLLYVDLVEDGDSFYSGAEEVYRRLTMLENPQ